MIDFASTKRSPNSHPGIGCKAPQQSPALDFDTPARAFAGLNTPGTTKFFLMNSSPSKPPTQVELDWSQADVIPFEDVTSEDFINMGDAELGGLDILQGFEKIGASSQPLQQQPLRSSKSHSKPPFGRSYTSTF